MKLGRSDLFKRLQSAEGKHGCGPDLSPIILIAEDGESEEDIRRANDIPDGRRVVIIYGPGRQAA